MDVSVDFVQIIYDWDQESKCYPFAMSYFNHTLTPFFENSVIQDVVLASSADKISVCSWKLKEKMKWNVCRPRELSLEVLKTDYQVLSFTCNTKNHSMLYAAEKWHPGFISTMKKLMEKMGEKMPSEVKNPIYQNHFSADQSVYKAYVNEYLIPAKHLMVTDPEISTLAWKDSDYSNLNKKNAATAEYLKEKIGVPYYPMIPFLLERLFSIYCHNKQIKVSYL
jgi:hypothetical protein